MDRAPYRESVMKSVMDEARLDSRKQGDRSIQNLRRVREDLGMSAAYFALSCGIPLGSLYKIEAGRYEPSREVRLRILAAVVRMRRVRGIKPITRQRLETAGLV